MSEIWKRTDKVHQDTVHWLFFDQKKKKTWNILFRKTRDSLSYPTGIGKLWSSNSGNHFKNPRAWKHQGHKTLAEKGCPHLLRPGSGSSPPSHPGTASSGPSPVTPAPPQWRPQPHPWRSQPPTTSNMCQLNLTTSTGRTASSRIKKMNPKTVTDLEGLQAVSVPTLVSFSQWRRCHLPTTPLCHCF